MPDQLTPAGAPALDQYQRNRIGTLRPLMQAIDAACRLREPAKRQVAAKLGLSVKRTEALYLDWKKRGDDALINRRKLPRAKKSAADTLSISHLERATLRQLVARCGSMLYAIEALADDPVCSPELRALILTRRTTRNYPKALLRAARVTPEMDDLARGPKRFNLHVATQYRDNYWIDSAGGRHPLTGGDLFECDDMSLNQPYWYEWPYGGDPLSDMFGVRLGRQMLACIDVASARWIGFDLVGRVRDAYRAEDIVRFLGNIVALNGLPRHGFRLERGIWKSKAVRGVTKVNDDSEKQLIGSIADAVSLHYVHSPNAKGIIEGAFDMLQTILALDGITIGRQRGEYERATALMLKCVDGRLHPSNAGFPHISAIAQRVSDAMEKFNARNKLGRTIQGIPEELYSAGISAAPLATLPDEQAHLFLPYREIRAIAGAHVRCRVEHYNHTFSFAIPAAIAQLGRGYRLLVCFDPANPHAGARAFDAETDGRIHFQSHAGQPYGILPYAPDAPQIDYRASRSTGKTKREYAGAIRSEFRSLGLEQGTNVSRASDGRGQVTQIARGAQIAAPENLPSADPLAARALQARYNHRAAPSVQARQEAAAAADARSSLLRRAAALQTTDTTP